MLVECSGKIKCSVTKADETITPFQLCWFMILVICKSFQLNAGWSTQVRPSLQKLIIGLNCSGGGVSHRSSEGPWFSPGFGTRQVKLVARKTVGHFWSTAGVPLELKVQNKQMLSAAFSLWHLSHNDCMYYFFMIMSRKAICIGNYPSGYYWGTFLIYVFFTAIMIQCPYVVQTLV